MKKFVAIIVGGTGQFGFNLSELLIKKKYKVIITTRSKKSKKKIINYYNKKIIFQNLDIYNKNQIHILLKKYVPNEVYYFAGQSSVSKSFNQKMETHRSNFNGCKNFLETIYKNKFNTKFINASSCEIFGKTSGKIKLISKKNPVSPYGQAKLHSFNITKKYRDKFRVKSYNSIIFNTESYLRDKSYLIPKICIASIKAKKTGLKTEFGNLNISREWNWCSEQVSSLHGFVKKAPQDFILSNGKNYSALQMLKFSFQYFKLDYKKYISINKKFFRKTDTKVKKSDWQHSLKINNLKREPKIFGKKIIIRLIQFYLNEQK